VRALLGLLYFIYFSTEPALASRQPVSFLRAHNFQLSTAHSLRSWLGVPELAKENAFQVDLLLAENREVWDVYSDIKSKDRSRIQSRLEKSYGQPLDAEAKAGFSFHLGKFEQTFFANAAVALMVNDPVFPELSGILFNDYTLSSSYTFTLPHGIKFRPTIQYGIRRTLDQSFTVGQLLDTKPNVKLKTYPYRFYSEASMNIERPFEFGILSASISSFPVTQKYYDYWKTEVSARSRNLLQATSITFPRQVYLWAGLSPFFGGAYNWGRTVQVGTSVGWTNFLRTDLFLFDNFRIAAIVTARIAFLHAEIFTFERSEDDHKALNSRQYGLALSARF